MNATECMPRETLKQYLAGWIDTNQTAEIEQHLSACAACEQTIAELESDPDTLFESVRNGDQQRKAAPENNSLLSAAMDRVKCLMDSEPATNEPKTSVAVGNLGVYQLIHPLGRGGMGAVYLARHRTLGKQVAIKLLPESWGLRREALARFQREIRAVGKLNHQSIVSATDAGEQHGTHYLVMEYVDGMDLSRIARLVGPLKIADACALARQVALGLSYAHAEGIVHRDVKPSNLILDSHGQTKILDFGLAQLCLWDEVSAELTSVGQLMGTLDYMAPEQAERSGSVDYRADLYSLGATLFRLLCGRAPLAAAPTLSPLDKLRLLAQHQPPKLDTLRSDAPAKLVEIVGSLLAREPADRPASAAHVAEQLAEFTQDADLHALLVQAQSADSQAGNSPEKKRVRFSELETGSVSAKASSTADRNGNYWMRWLVAAALIPLGLFAAVLIVLETQKGQLVIESEVADVHIKLLRDGKATQDLRIDTGATSTRLTADKYEIVLDSPSDAIRIDKNQFEIKRGQIVVARIRSTEGTPADAATRNADPALVLPGQLGLTRDPFLGSQDPLYDGKSLEAWLAQLSRDRSPKAISQALIAIEAMTNPASADRIRDALTKILPQLDGKLSISVGENAVGNVDYLGFQILAKAAPRRAYFELLATLLSTADTDWGKRLLTVGTWPKTAEVEADIEPLVTWLTTNVLSAANPTEKDGAWMESAAWWFRNRLLLDSLPKQSDESAARMISTLQKCPHLGFDFWLAVPPEPTWSLQIRELVVSHAMRAMVDPNTSPAHVSEAAMILTSILGSSKDAPGVQLESLKSAVQSRLTSIAGDSGRLWQTVPVYPSFVKLGTPHLSHLPLRTRSTQSGVREVFELLDLAYLLKSAQAATFDVSLILKATEDTYQKMEKPVARIPRHPASSMIFASADWPALDNFNYPGPIGVQEVTSFTSQDWLEYLLYINAADVAGITLSTPEPPARSPRSKQQ